MNENRINKIINILIYIMIFAYVFCFAVINFKGFNLYCEADIYEDMQVAKMMWEQKTLFPNGWVFGNQYYVVATPVLAALVYGICGNINLVMKLATSIMTILIVLSFVWLIKPFVNRTAVMCGILLLFASLIGPEMAKQLEGQLFYLMASYYACYLISLLLSIGCFARLIENKPCSKIMIVISLLLSFACGMQSLRQTAVLVLPLLACLVFFRNRKTIIFSVCSLISNILGVFAIKIISPASHSIYGQTTLAKPSEWLNNFLVSLDGLKKVTEIRWLLKGNPIGLFALALIIFVILSIVLLIKNNKDNKGMLSISLILLFSIFAIFFACVFVNVNMRYIYMFSWYPLVAVSIAYLVNTTNVKNKIYCILITMMIIGSLGNLIISYGKEVNESLSNSEKSYKQLTGEWIKNSEYEYVYGEWLTMGDILPYAEGKVVGGAWANDSFHILGYLNPQYIYIMKITTKRLYICLQKVKLKKL